MRFVDASVMLIYISGNIMASAYAIAEKALDTMLKDAKANYFRLGAATVALSTKA